MGFTYRQGGTGGQASAATSITITLGSTPLKGSLLCAAVTCGNTEPVPSIKDGNNNAFTITSNSPAISTSAFSAVYLAYLIAPANVSNVINFTFQSDTFVQGWVDEFTVVGGIAAFDKDVVASNVTTSGTTANQPTITPAFANSVLYSAVNPNGLITAPASGANLGSWTGTAGGIATSNNNADTEYALNISSATAVQYTDSATNDPYCAMAMAFYLASANYAVEEYGQTFSPIRR